MRPVACQRQKLLTDASRSTDLNATVDSAKRSRSATARYLIYLFNAPSQRLDRHSYIAHHRVPAARRKGDATMIAKRLPRLGGAFLNAYRLLWAVLFLGGLVGTIYFEPTEEAAGQRATSAAFALGFSPFIYESLEGQMGGPFGTAGRRAGYQDGDVLLTVDGRKVTYDPVARAAVLKGPPGSTATLTLRRQTGENYTVRVARDPGIASAAYAGSGMTFEARRWIQFGFYALANLVASAAALLLFIRRPNDPVAQLLSFSLVLGQFAIVNWVAAVPDPVITAKTSITLLAWVCAVLLFPDGRLSTRWHWAALGAYIVLVLYGIAGFYWLGTFGFLLPGLYATAAVALAIAMIAQFRRTPAGIERQQVKFVIFGIVAMALLNVIAGALLVAERPVQSEGMRAWITLAKHLAMALSQLAIPAGLLVSLLRYRLYDAEAVISRSAAYAFLTLLLGAAFAGSEKIIEVLGEEMFGESSRALAAGLGAAVAATLVAPLHNRVHRWTEQRFQKALLHFRRDLPECVGDLRETAGMPELLDEVLARVEAGTRAVRSALTIDGETVARRGSEGDFPLVVPLRIGHQQAEIGTLLVGPRPDGSAPGKDEREALAEIADPIARAIRIVATREAREAQAEARQRLHETRFAELEATVARLLGAPKSGRAAGC
ncbi:MAG TPA: hypothetical protein VGC56_06765 [Allosphingosinicella sp.]